MFQKLRLLPLVLSVIVLAASAMPSFASEAYFAGVKQLKLGKIALAKAYFAKAVIDEPSSIAAHYQLANCNYDLGQYDRALCEYNVCLTLNPDVKTRAYCTYAMNHIHNVKRSIGQVAAKPSSTTK